MPLECVQHLQGCQLRETITGRSSPTRGVEKQLSKRRVSTDARKQLYAKGRTRNNHLQADGLMLMPVYFHVFLNCISPMKPHHIQQQNCGEVMSISQPSGFPLLTFHPMNSRDEISHGKAERHARQLTARITRRTLFQITPLNCHPQTQSPLFSILPPELRNQIFELAVSQFEDRTKPFPENAFWYRPDHYYELRTETSLLRTCRLIYYETSVIPMRSATHHFYYNRGPKDLPVDNYLHHLARKEQDNIYHLHFFASVASWDFEYLRKLLYLPFKKVTLSLRHSDWLGWKSDAKLWLGNINHELLLPHSCQEFILELETLQQKKHQLDEIVQRAVTWEFQADDGAMFICETDRLVTSSWTGRSDLNDIHWEVHGPEPSISYHIVKLRWRPGKLVVTDNPEQLRNKLRARFGIFKG